MEWRPAGWSVCLPLLIFLCTIKSRSSFLGPAHLGGPEKRAKKQLYVCVSVWKRATTHSYLSIRRDSWLNKAHMYIYYIDCAHHHHHNRFTALFPGPSGWAGARRELLDFMVQGKINGGRHTDHPVGRHSIQTNQCLLPPSPHIFTGRMPFLSPNQQHQSTEGN